DDDRRRTHRQEQCRVLSSRRARGVKLGQASIPGVASCAPRRRRRALCLSISRTSVAAGAAPRCAPRCRSATFHRMTAIDFVDVATARSAPGVRIVVSSLVPSPWSEATKGLFRIADVPVLAVRRGRDAAEITAWTGVDNVPVVFHAAEPPRTNWAAITMLAAQLAGPDAVIPEEIGARVEAMGLLHEIAGEHGIGWNARL